MQMVHFSDICSLCVHTLIFKSCVGNKISQSTNNCHSYWQYVVWLSAHEAFTLFLMVFYHHQPLKASSSPKHPVVSPLLQKADKSALESKVSRLQFDSVTEQLNAMFHELLHKVTGQEQDWHKVIDRLSTEMECKVNTVTRERQMWRFDLWHDIWPLSSVAEQDRVGLCEEAARRSLEEHPREAAGSGSSRARGRCCFKKVRVQMSISYLLMDTHTCKSCVTSAERRSDVSLCLFTDSWWADFTASPVTDLLSSTHLERESELITATV